MPGRKNWSFRAVDRTKSGVFLNVNDSTAVDSRVTQSSLLLDGMLPFSGQILLIQHRPRGFVTRDRPCLLFCNKTMFYAYTYTDWRGRGGGGKGGERGGGLPNAGSQNFESHLSKQTKILFQLVFNSSYFQIFIFNYLNLQLIFNDYIFDSFF